MNGDIVVSSNLHKGTCFTFTVNVRVTPDINYILEQYGSQLRRGTVLVIQNNVESRLNILGYSNIDTAKDGGEALNLLMRKSYDIVLIDNIMPGMTGIEVAVEFGNLCKEPLTNFAIISAGITDSDIATLHSVGVIHTLMKPYGLEELRILLSNI